MSTNTQILNLYKNLGETPRERLERLRAQRPLYAREVLSYAGRLDPMAEGVMLCLVGSANKHREQYLDLSKEYTLDVLFGFATDTYDVLGRVMQVHDQPEVTWARIQQGINEFRGTRQQEYPPFSSKTVEGKSLFEWARGGGAFGAMVLPQRTVSVYQIDVTAMYKVNEELLLSYIENSVGLVQGDFRQEEIIRTWKHHLRSIGGNRVFPGATIHVACSSGTYVRSIAHELGKYLGIPALALHILRTQVGEYEVSKALR